MRKLDVLFSSEFATIEPTQMHGLFGGIEKATQLQDGATLRRLGGGCSQADVNKNDKQSSVGDVICVPDTLSKDTTVTMFVLETFDGEINYEMTDNSYV